MAILPTGEDIRISVAQNGYVVVSGQFLNTQADRFRVAETDQKLLEVIAELVNAPGAPPYRVWLSRHGGPKETEAPSDPRSFALAFCSEYGGDPGVIFSWFNRAMSVAAQQERNRDSMKVQAEFFAFRTAMAIAVHDIVRKLITDIGAASITNTDGSMTIIPVKAMELYRLMMAKSVYDLEPTDQLLSHEGADKLIKVINEAAASPVEVADPLTKSDPLAGVASDGR